MEVTSVAALRKFCTHVITTLKDQQTIVSIKYILPMSLTMRRGEVYETLHLKSHNWWNHTHCGENGDYFKSSTYHLDAMSDLNFRSPEERKRSTNCVNNDIADFRFTTNHFF